MSPKDLKKEVDGLWILERAESEGWRLREGTDRVEQEEDLIQN